MYSELVTALKALGTPVTGQPTIQFAEDAWENAPTTGNYGVIALDMAAATVWGDSKLQQQALQGTVDAFLRTDDRNIIELIQSVLEASGACYRLYSIQYEVERKLKHYEWIFELEAL